MITLQHQLQELYLLECSLLPGEQLSIDPSADDRERWQELLTLYTNDSVTHLSQPPHSLAPVRFQVTLERARTWFIVELPSDYGGSPNGTEPSRPVVSVKGENIGRSEQERWQAIIKDKMADLQDSEYPVYELIAAHLLPLLHGELDASSASPTISSPPSPSVPVTHNLHYHALLTSHHLKAPSKRRSLQQWAGELSLIGFAKVGHPGVIYCEGMQAQVEEFVTNVKALQWLALRVRFIEPLPEACQNTVGQAESKNCANDRQEVAPRKQWVEFEKWRWALAVQARV
ncbi:hypothetical protein AcW1_001446 [Taiwanofungus camphoratus]|nr:hypothetical protein AcW2_000022 [Antrodia cinnamomea]KAI0964680.1 hypothetical protein AcW1_001446 [Antrodia cinnamomea]